MLSLTLPLFSVLARGLSCLAGVRGIATTPWEELARRLHERLLEFSIFTRAESGYGWFLINEAVYVSLLECVFDILWKLKHLIF